MSDHGLLTTVGYKLGRDKPAFYALEVQDLHLNLKSSFCDLRLELLTAGGSFVSQVICVCVSFASCQGSVAIAGAVVRWLQDNLGIIGSSEELGTF